MRDVLRSMTRETVALWKAKTQYDAHKTEAGWHKGDPSKELEFKRLCQPLLVFSEHSASRISRCYISDRLRNRRREEKAGDDETVSSETGP
jgi:hypothetical protein